MSGRVKSEEWWSDELFSLCVSGVFDFAQNAGNILVLFS
jgi:hypothetical protein